MCVFIPQCISSLCLCVAFRACTLRIGSYTYTYMHVSLYVPFHASHLKYMRSLMRRPLSQISYAAKTGRIACLSLSVDRRLMTADENFSSLQITSVKRIHWPRQRVDAKTQSTECDKQWVEPQDYPLQDNEGRVQ